MNRSFLVAVASAALLVGCGGDAQQPPSTAVTPPSTPTAVAPPPTSAPTTASTESTSPPTPKPSMMDLQKKAGMAFDAAFNGHDAKGIAAVYAPDAVMSHLTPKGWEDVKGRDEIEKHTAAMFTAYPDVKTCAERVFSIKNVMAVQWLWKGTHKGDLGEMKATNKEAGMHGMSILWFGDDGQITKEHVYADFGTVLAQEGVIKAKARPVPTLLTTPPEILLSKDDDGEKKNGDLGKQWLDTFNKHDVKALLALVTDDILDSELAQPADVKGAKAYEKSHDAWFKAFPDAKLVVDQGWAAGDWLMGEGTFTGTHKGPLGPFKPTNKPVVVHYAQVARFKDGKMAESYVYYTNGEMLEQLGLLPKPKAGPAPKPKDIK